MHSYIYEITQSRLEEEEWADDYALSGDGYLYYYSMLDESERLEAIKALASEKWFQTVFEPTDEPDVFALRETAFEPTDEPDVFAFRGIEPLIKEYHKRILDETSKLVESGSVDTYPLRDAIDYPFGGIKRYLLPDWCGGVSEPTRELLEMLVSEKPAKIYINSVFSYKY